MTDFKEWELVYPEAAYKLQRLLHSSESLPVGSDSMNEAQTQQRVRFNAARRGVKAWRNNVGATPTKCGGCGLKTAPIRYGLANDSHKLNSVIKSSDLILAIPTLIKKNMVGQTLARFGAIECKKSGWKYTGKRGESQQAAWLGLILSLGGFAQFSTGDVAW